MSSDKNVLLRAAGWAGLILVLFLAYALGKSAHNKATRNLNSRLELTRQRFQNCEAERRMLKGPKSEADELSLAQSDRAALRQENELLTQDNEELKADNDALEKEIDDMKEQLDQKDFVTDDEIEALEETMSLGNNSQALTDLLEDIQVAGEASISKDQLLEILVTELKRKSVGLRDCYNQKFPPPVPWEKLPEAKRKALLQGAIEQLAKIGSADAAKVAELVAEWAPRHPEGVSGLKRDVKARVAALFAEDARVEVKAKPKTAEATKPVAAEAKKSGLDLDAEAKKEATKTA